MAATHHIPAKQRFAKHGHTRQTSAGKSSPEYNTWRGMKDRCTNPKSANYKDYGGRGITLCESWKLFANFLADMGLKPTTRHTIERIDNDKGYDPSNCRWATRREQGQNTRSCCKVTFQGVTLTLAEWERKQGLGSSTIHVRLSRGWSLAEAITTPALRRKPQCP